MQFQLVHFSFARDLELSRAENGADIQIFVRIAESVGVSFGVEQLVARILVAPAETDELLFRHATGFRLKNRQSLAGVSWVIRI